MAGESPFEKKFVEESAKTDLPGVLDQLTLPPAFIEFVRKYQQAIKIAAIVITVVVIVWAIYDSYRTNRLEKSGSALYSGLQIDDNERSQALEKVIADYNGTPASTWAHVELAHTDMKNAQFSGAIEKYESIRTRVGTKSPLYPLVTYGIAQAFEAQEKFKEALAEYEGLKKTVGFEAISVFGMARIHEIEGRKDEALKIYEQYLSSFTGAEQNNPDKVLIEEKIARIRATM